MAVDFPLGRGFLKLNTISVHRVFFFSLKEENHQFFKNISLKFQLSLVLVE